MLGISARNLAMSQRQDLLPSHDPKKHIYEFFAGEAGRRLSCKKEPPGNFAEQKNFLVRCLGPVFFGGIRGLLVDSVFFEFML